MRQSKERRYPPLEQKEQLTPTQILNMLDGFIGSEHSYRMYPDVIVTDGVKFLCEQAQCFWLIDCISSYQTIKNVVIETFQVIDLTVDLEKHTGLIVVTDGNRVRLTRQELEYTDFPCLKFVCITRTVQFYSLGNTNPKSRPAKPACFSLHLTESRISFLRDFSQKGNLV